jgi:hypothetical protein
MIARLIRWSAANRLLVVLAAVALALAGFAALRTMPVDALPDLSDTQVIIRTTWPGQAPQIVENQVTYPLTTTMLSVPGAKTVRGYSFFGDSYVYVIFEDGTTSTGRGAACSNICPRCRAACRRVLPPRSAPTRQAWAGSTNMRWWIVPAATISRSSALCKTGSSATS